MDNLVNFNNHLPVKVRFGEGVSNTLSEVIKELGSSNAFLMVDERIEKFNAAAAKLIENVKANTKITLFEKPAGEPTIAMVEDAIFCR
jgi:alcohol dehydrogenase